jgi:hypothetical protein
VKFESNLLKYKINHSITIPLPAFLNSQSKLSQLAKKVRAYIQAGKIKKMGIDDL